MDPWIHVGITNEAPGFDLKLWPAPAIVAICKPGDGRSLSLCPPSLYLSNNFLKRNPCGANTDIGAFLELAAQVPC